MIIFGLRSGNIKQDENSLADCAQCGTEQSVHLHFYIRYFHIFWIPFIPLYKTGISQCKHCLQALNQKQMPSHLSSVYATSLKKAKTPIGYYSLLIVSALVLAAAIFTVFIGKNS